MTMKTKRILLYFLPFLISFSGWGKTHLLILSGQSNMEWRLNQTRKPGQTEEDFMKELGSTDIPGVRLFTVQNAIAPAPKSDVAGTWARSDQSAALGFSACG
jgi:hypothetical protein